MYRTPAVAFGILFAFATSAPVLAEDAGLAGAKVQLAQSPAREKLKLSAKDEAVTFPAPATADDPTIAGATLDLQSATGAAATIDLPAAGWTAASGGYSFKSKSLPEGTTSIRSAKLKNGRMLKATGSAVDLPATPLEGVAVRLTIGASRYCAVFGSDSISEDEGGSFKAQSDSSALVDCEDDTMANASCAAWPSCTGTCIGGGTCGPDAFESACQCALPSEPCGGTASVCNGTCGDGEACAKVPAGSTFGECICLPEGATPCGSTGVPTCGGDCDGGRVCEPVMPPGSVTGGPACACGPASGCLDGGIVCGDGFACGTTQFGTPVCYPIACPGTYPTCGGSCGDGGTCLPFRTEGSVLEVCTCAPSDTAPCDVCGGGIACPAGDVCTIFDATTCGCEAP